MTSTSRNEDVPVATQSASNAEIWSDLLDFVANGADGSRELDWSYLGMPIWPIIKAQVMMRASNVLNAGREMRLASQKAGTAPPPLRAAPARNGAFYRSLLARLAQGKTRHTPRPRPFASQPVIPANIGPWPEFPAELHDTDIICFGYAANHKKVGDHFFQLCMDPLRVALAKRGVRTTGLLVGIGRDDPGIAQAALVPTLSIENEFRVVRRQAAKLPPVNLSALNGFDAWWHELVEILHGEEVTTVDHISAVVQQTAAVGFWLLQEFSKKQPKAVLMSAYYGLMGHGGSWACRHLGIPIADVQHGVAGAGHHAYEWQNAPAEGFGTLPTHFFKWSDREVEEMRRASGDWTQSLLAIGNNWRLLDSLLLSETFRSSSVLPEDVRETAQHATLRDQKTVEDIKAGFGPGIDVLIAMHPDETLPWLPRLLRIAPPDWRFWIRMHPGEYKGGAGLAKRRDEFTGNNVIVEAATELPLNVILKHMNAILTKFSSVALDAAAYGVPTVAYTKAGLSFFGPTEQGAVRYVNEVAEQMLAALTVRVSPYAKGLMPPQADVECEQLGANLAESLGLT